MADINCKFRPEQSEEDKAQVRQGYQDLLQELQSSKRELALPDNHRLTEMMAKANDLMGRVGNTKDFSLDARFFAASAQLGAERIRAEPLEGSQFTVENLMTLLKEILARTVGQQSFMTVATAKNPPDWAALGREALRGWRGAIVPDHMLGPISVGQPPPKVTRLNAPRRLREVAPVVEATAMDERTIAAHREKLNETTKNVFSVYEQLEDLGRPIRYYPFILHPTDFARSVEMMFYVAFLVANDKASLTVENDELMLQATGVPQNATQEPEDLRFKRQHIFTLTMPRWRQLVAKYNIKKAMVTV